MKWFKNNTLYEVIVAGRSSDIVEISETYSEIFLISFLLVVLLKALKLQSVQCAVCSVQVYLVTRAPRNLIDPAIVPAGPSA